MEYRRLRGIDDDLGKAVTVQEGRLYVLQSHAAKRTPWAALRVACDPVEEGLIDRQTALERLAELDLNSLQMTRLASGHESPPLSVGVAACPGVARLSGSSPLVRE